MSNEGDDNDNIVEVVMMVEVVMQIVVMMVVVVVMTCFSWLTELEAARPKLRRSQRMDTVVTITVHF